MFLLAVPILEIKSMDAIFSEKGQNILKLTQKRTKLEKILKNDR